MCRALRHSACSILVGLLLAWSAAKLSAAAIAHASRLELTALAQAASGAKAGPDRATGVEAFLSALEQAQGLGAETALHHAWTGYLLAETDVDRARVLQIAARVKDARARMLIGSFREFPGLRQAYATADRENSALLVGPPVKSEKKRAPREIYGTNSFDVPHSCDGWADPQGFVGRWSDGELNVDIVAYPLGNFAARLHPQSPDRTLVGFATGVSLSLVGPGLQGKLEHGRLQFAVDGKSRTLVRTTVGITSFDRRPAGARVLLDASTGLAHFRHAKGDARWKLQSDGTMEIDPAVGSLFTKNSFNDLHGYLEFRHAFNRESLGPRRGNSGLYLHNAYEVQLVDSFGLPPSETSAGSVYHIAAPRVTASAPPLEWQSLEFRFRAPRFDANGRKTASARLTLWLNAVKVHDDLEIPNPTAGSVAGGQALKDPPGPQPLMIQNHGNLLQFRHIWVMPLDS